jgi:hypothetical protein
MLSVGSFLVNCRLQMGQGLVITYVMVVLPLARYPFHVVARRLPENVLGRECSFSIRSTLKHSGTYNILCSADFPFACSKIPAVSVAELCWPQGDGAQ